ncbi:MAG: hypothetical protein U0175_37285 [Caldilineaceae bacterium]
MEEITILIKDKNKANLLTSFLQALDFVTSVRVTHKKNGKHISASQKRDNDFFAVAGLWKDRNIDLQTIRSKAWPRQQ